MWACPLMYGYGLPEVAKAAGQICMVIARPGHVDKPTRPMHA